MVAILNHSRAQLSATDVQ